MRLSVIPRHTARKSDCLRQLHRSGAGCDGCFIAAELEAVVRRCLAMPGPIRRLPAIIIMRRGLQSPAPARTSPNRK